MTHTVADYRRENLRRYINTNGGPGAVAAKLGYSNASFLVQMAGPSPIRQVSEKTARQFETTLALRPGYFDMPVQIDTPAPQAHAALVTPTSTVTASAAPVQHSEQDFEALMKLVYDVTTKADITLSVPKYMTLVTQSLLIEQKKGGKLEASDLEPLVDLMK